MAYRDRPLAQNDKGDDVIELQMRLAGFKGTVPDGDFGPGTLKQVTAFQSEWMKMAQPTGLVDDATFDAIDAFGAAHPVNFDLLKCKCGVCGGFGRGKFKDQYWQGNSEEKFHRYEYPGIHRMLLWTFRAAMFHAKPKGWQLTVNSSYRCSVDSQQHNRKSTNHNGKAIDMDVVNPATKEIDRQNSNALRQLLVDTANAQIGWDGRNKKALEPADIAPTWVHLDVRCYDRKYLDDKYFVKDQAALDKAPA
jgi:hypothetical protein